MAMDHPLDTSGSARLAERIARLQANLRTTPGEEGDTLMLSPLWISGMIDSLLTEGADAGINGGLLVGHERGLLIEILPWANMREGDWVEVFWGGGDAVASSAVTADQAGHNFTLYVAADHALEGIHPVHYSVRRSGSGNTELSQPINVMTRRLKPGGIDPEPDVPGHQDLLPAEPALPPGGIIDEEAARNGVEVTVNAYPHMLLHDKLDLSWGGVILSQLVTQADLDNGFVTFQVTEETILAAGDSEQLVLVYKVRDDVHNLSDGWSMRQYVHVEVGTGLFDSPIIDNPDPQADPWDVIDLEQLGDRDLLIQVFIMGGGLFQVGDQVTVNWTGTKADGQVITVEPPAQAVVGFPRILEFSIPNADVIQLVEGRGVASYAVSRDGAAVGVSKRAFASFLGIELKLPKPYTDDAVNGSLDPALASTVVVVPGEALEAGDVVVLSWLGTRANGTPLLATFERAISGSGAGKPVLINVAGPDYIAPLDGGSLVLSYTLTKSGGTVLPSERESLRVGEAQFELPAPVTRPPVDGGILDPDQIPDPLEIVVHAYTNMKAGQTVRLTWLASTGPNHEDWMPISAAMVGKDIVFTLGRAHILENLTAKVALSYRVESPGEQDRDSAPAHFTVGQEQRPAPPPVVVEAVGDLLNPADALDGATVRIPLDAGLVFGDFVDVIWQGTGAGGSTRVERQIFQEDVGKPLDVKIGYEFVAANADGDVVVHYEVFPAQGPVRVSEPVTLRVQSAALPLPSIDQAEGNEVNPDDVQQGATVRIHASALVREGDVVKVKVVSSASGGSVELSHTVPSGGAGQPVTLSIPHSVINASVGTSIDLSYQITRKAGGPIEQSGVRTYLVNRNIGSGPLLVMGARHNGCAFWARSSPRMISVFYPGSLLPMLAEWRYADSDQWIARSQWFDNKPWLKLYVRSETDAVELNPANIIGNGVSHIAADSASFVAMRDEVVVGSERQVDMAAWGASSYGGDLDSSLIALKNVVEVSSARGAYAARLGDGSVVCWGETAYGGTTPVDNGGFVQIRSHGSGFVGRKSTGELVAWGTPGSPVPADVLVYKDYIGLYSTGSAYAALRSTGNIKVWGMSQYGGTMRPDQEGMNGFTQVMGSHFAFAALHDGVSSKTVEAWGHGGAGGRVPQEISDLTNIKTLAAATLNAFAILLDSGHVRAWGAESEGGSLPAAIATMTNVVEVTGNWHAFCARLSNGHVVAWGNQEKGGLVPKAIAELSDIVQVTGTKYSFAALRRNGTVVVWGDPHTGGDISGVASKLVGVRAIYGNHRAFTALTSSGAVVTWGEPTAGGDSSEEQHRLDKLVTVGRAISLAEAEPSLSRNVGATVSPPEQRG